MEIYIKFAFSMKPQKDKFLTGFDWQYSFLKYLDQYNGVLCGFSKSFLYTLVTIQWLTSKFEWTLDDIRIEKIISAPIPAKNSFLEVSALLDVRHCPKLKSCAMSRKYKDATLRKLQKP